MGRVYLFPGQGSQVVGMGKALAEAMPVARQVFEEVDDALDMHLTRLIFEGPQDDLKLTENTQPALMAVSVAVARVIEEAGRKISDSILCVAGHSLGEYSALVSSGSLALSDAAKLLRLRGKAMQMAVPVDKGAMAALIQSDYNQAIEISAMAAQDEVCEVANDNGAGQVVISGDKTAVERAISIAKERGVKRCVLLPVSAPFHCKLMASAAETMEEALQGILISKPLVPIISNVSARSEIHPERIRVYLVEQITRMVRWRECMDYMFDTGADEFIELGSGKVLSGIVKRMNKDAFVMSIHQPDDIEAFFKRP